MDVLLWFDWAWVCFWGAFAYFVASYCMTFVMRIFKNVTGHV